MAVIVEVPVAAAIAIPVVEPIVAVAVVPEAQVTAPVSGCVVPSLSSSSAVYDTVEPTETVSVPGVTCSPTTTGVPVTVKTVLPVTPLSVAEIVVAPGLTAVAKPAAVIVAFTVRLEDQLTCEVRSCVGPLAYVPVAVNCCVAAGASEGVAGVTAMDTSCGDAVTVNTAADEVTPLKLAVIFEVPPATPVANPPVEIEATVVLEDAQVAELVTSFEVLFE
jgi:hypothetical protein